MATLNILRSSASVRLATMGAARSAIASASARVAARDVVHLPQSQDGQELHIDQPLVSPPTLLAHLGVFLHVEVGELRERLGAGSPPPGPHCVPRVPRPAEPQREHQPGPDSGTSRGSSDADDPAPDCTRYLSTHVFRPSAETRTPNPVRRES